MQGNKKKIISHRGNLMGPEPKTENNPEHIRYVLFEGYDVEIDVWCLPGPSAKDGFSWYLGHDMPQYEIDSSFLKNPRLWCHAKNSLALEEMLKMEHIHCFWHQEDEYTITSKGLIWCYPNKKVLDNSICLLFEKGLIIPENCFGICTDFVYYYDIDYDKKT